MTGLRWLIVLCLPEDFIWVDAVVIIFYAGFCFDFLYKAFTLAIGSGASFQDADICPLEVGY